MRTISKVKIVGGRKYTLGGIFWHKDRAEHMAKGLRTAYTRNGQYVHGAGGSAKIVRYSSSHWQEPAGIEYRAKPDVRDVSRISSRLTTNLYAVYYSPRKMTRFG